MVEKGQKWSKMVKNGGPDLKRAQRTGLSARRVRRTKSIGPKGLQLEVGARRAPRLLVQNTFPHDTNREPLLRHWDIVKTHPAVFHFADKLAMHLMALAQCHPRFFTFKFAFSPYAGFFICATCVYAFDSVDSRAFVSRRWTTPTFFPIFFLIDLLA